MTGLKKSSEFGSRETVLKYHSLYSQSLGVQATYKCMNNNLTKLKRPLFAKQCLTSSVLTRGRI